jgi:amino acid adenylation domain-containing protein
LWNLFTGIARTTPGAPAVRDAGTSYTYAQAHSGCLNAANALIAAGVAPGDAVLVCTDQNAHGVLAILAVSAAGGTPVPVEMAGPQARFERIVAASGAHIALVDDQGRETVSGMGIPALAIGEAMSSSRAGLPARAARAAGSSDLAYVLFTSGSTGAPKGVEVTQANVLSLLAGAPRWHRGGAADVWGCFHSFTFDISMWEIWRPLTMGAQIFVFPRAAHIDADLAYSLAGEQGITVLCQTPTAARLLANRVSRSGMPPHLRRLMLAGERLDFAALKPFAAAVAGGQLEIWNLYGPTEATIYCTGYRIGPGDIGPEKRSLIGRALPGVNVAVHEPDADGIGELWITGDQVAAGYRGDPELTRERFVVDAAGHRAYRSGDLVRDCGDGALEFIRRAGGFVKVRGYRIEPGEIVSGLCAHPDVEQAAAFVTEVLPWGATVVCAVAPRRGAAVTEIALRRHAAQALPYYMRPARIVLVAALPQLPSGKLDEPALRAGVEQQLRRELPARSQPVSP